jgi:hypothetical protein
MAKTYSNKYLLILVFSLAGLFALSKVYQWVNADSNFKQELSLPDTAGIQSIEILRPANAGFGKTILTKGSDQAWTVSDGKWSKKAFPEAVQQLLVAIQEIKADQLVAKKADSWPKYEITDSLATLVKVTGADQSLIFRLGKINFKQTPGMGGQGNVSGSTYIRFEDRPEVYATPGFAAFSFNREASSFLDPTVAKVNPQNVDQISFSYAGDSSFVLEKKNGNWMIGDALCDSTKVEVYLQGLSSYSLNSFGERSNLGPEVGKLLIREGGIVTHTLTLYTAANGAEYLLESSRNPDNLFKLNLQNEWENKFKGKGSFVAVGS